MTNPMLAELDAVVRLIGASERELVTHPDLSAKAVNFLRTHHATLADMAKRLEAAERDAARYRWLRADGADQEEVTERLSVYMRNRTGLDAAIDAATQEDEG